MADFRKPVQGALKAVQAASKAADQALESKRLAQANKEKPDYADPLKPAEMRMSEALGNAGAEGKTLNFTETDRSRVKGQNRGGVGFAGLQHYSIPHKKANTVWGFGNTATAEKKIRQNDPENTLWTTFVGSPQQHKSNSVVIGDAIKEFQKSVKQGVVPREQIMLMNKRLNEITDQKTGAKVFENGFDLTDPSALDVANTFSRRAAVGDVMLGLGVKGPMSQLDFKKEFPDTKFTDGSNIENILKRETDPDLVNAGTYDVGNRLFVMDGKIIQRSDLNEAFPEQVTGYDLGMKYQLVPPDKAMRDFYKAREGRKDKNDKPSPVSYYDLSRANPSQKVDEDYLTFLQKEGYKKGGAIERKETAEEMDKFHKCFKMHKAFGGAVVKKVDGGKIAKGVMSVFDKASKAADAAMASKALPAAERDANLAKFLSDSVVKDRLYHGTKNNIKSFDLTKRGNSDISSVGGGVYLTLEPSVASFYSKIVPGESGANVMPVYAQIKNPFEYDLAMPFKSQKDSNEFSRKLQEAGYDSIIKRDKDGQISELVMLEPNKIKSATGNRGTYDITDPDINKAVGGGVHMVEGGKLAKGITGALTKASKMADDQIAAQAIGKAAESAGMKAPVTANKPLTTVQDFHTSFGDSVRKRAADMQATMDSLDYKYDKGQRVFTEDSAKRNFSPLTVLGRVLEGNRIMREDPNDFLSKKIIDEATGKAKRTPHEPGYKVRLEHAPDNWSEFVIPESAIKGSVDFARGGRVEETPEEMARFQKRFALHKATGGKINIPHLSLKKPKKFDDGGIASPSDEVNQGAAFGIYQKPKGGEDLRRGGEHSGFMAELLAKMAKDQGKQEVSSLDKPRAVTDLLNRGVLANNPLSAVIDMVNMGLVPLDVLGSALTGRNIKVSSDKPFLGSEYVKDLMNQYGVTSGEERPMMETALSFASPAAMIKGAIKATDAAKKAPELMKKASDAFTSSKMSPLATEAKTASAGKPTGATYATKQEGPFFRVSPTTLDTSKAKTRGIREGDELQSPTPLGEGAGSTGRETPQLLSSEEVGRIIADPVANEPLNIAKKYTQETQGVDFGVPNIPESSLAKQSAIGRAQQLAVEGSPEYKTAVFDAYAKQMPDVLEQAGAKNYDDLMEKAYRQMAKETDDQFKILPYNFSYHRAGEGNYNGAMDMASDVHGNKHLYVYQGGDKHDFLNRIDPASGLNENEKFRAVHDLLGHAIYGNQFGPKGEEMAWAVHSQMYSPLARLAMTAETRGQNSMVNYSPLNANLKAELAKYDNMANEARRKGDQTLLNKINAAKRQAYAGFEFAPNKAVLLPPEFLSPQYAGGMPDYLQAANRPAKGTETQSALTHFSNNPNLQMLDPKRYGTGIKGAEAERLRDYAGGVKDRSYFYMGEPGLVAPEAGLGVNRYRGEASSLYDITQDPLNFQTLARESNRTPFTAKVNQGVTYPLQDANDIERLVKEYGYEGMANPKATKPMAIMFKETPVRRQARGGLTLMK